MIELKMIFLKKLYRYTASFFISPAFIIRKYKAVIKYWKLLQNSGVRSFFLHLQPDGK